ncbi:MAG: copper homeostasis protein CutC [Sedimentisphaerales bacterium]|nr:copper homeostasis protein CutC [Sedimentisphaerales bacterium]
MPSKILIEVCCGSVDDAVEAAKGRADRIELNSSLFLGGLTPSLGSVIETKRRLNIPVMVMIRPRAGGFCYTQAEMAVMLTDAKLAIEHNADGLVFGILTEGGSIDMERCRQIIELAQGRQIVFHRAFDVTPDPFKALDQLIELGFTRVLTSGQQRSVPEGAELIKKLITRAAGRIEILPGGGIRPHNVRTIIEQTGTNQVHLSAFGQQLDKSTHHRPQITFGGALHPPEDRYNLIDSTTIQSISDLLNL